MINIDVELRGASFDEIAHQFGALPNQVKSARSRALRKTQTWFKTRVKRDLAKAIRVPQRSVADRFYTSRVRQSDAEAKIWAGAWNLDVVASGTPRQIGARSFKGKKARSQLAGVKIGNRRFYRGAFVGSPYGGRDKVWIRLSSRWYSRALYPSNHRAGDRFGQSGARGRFPVVRAAIPIDGELEALFDRYGDGAEAEFFKRFSQELNYEINVKGNQ